MSELVATAPIRNLPVPIKVPAGFNATLERVRAILRQPAVQKAKPALLLLGLIGLAALAYMMLARPAQRELFHGLADADKAAMADALTASGIKYAIDRDTGTLSVSDNDYYQAKMLLAQAGLPKAAPSGDDTLASLPMGASRAVEGERLRSAREQDLARTIEAIDAVQTARVHIAAEEPSVFLRDEKEAAASVMLRLQPGRTLSDNQVTAIANLVASSVPGLSAEGVAIVDQTGRLLSKAGGDPASAAADRQVALQAQVESRYAQALDKLLIPLVGAGNYTAEVHADLDFAEVQATRESYPKDLQAIRAENGGWTKEGGPEGPAIGIPGALSNTPPAASTLTAQNPAAPPPGQPAGSPLAPGAPGATAAGATAIDPTRTTENYARTFELGREVSVTRNPVGGVKRLSVAVALKDGTGKAKLNAADLAKIEGLIRGAVGADQARGDLIAVSARAFAPDADAASAAKWYEASWVPMAARNGSALLIALVLVFGVARPMMKRKAGPVETPVAAPQPTTTAEDAERAKIGKQIAAALEADSQVDAASVTLDMIEGAPGYAARAALIRNFVKQDPARAALVVRDLIRADAGKEERNG